MSETNDADRKIFLPSLGESIAAFRVASDVKDLIDGILSTGKYDYDRLTSLGHSLFELESQLLGGTQDISERCIALKEKRTQQNDYQSNGV